MNWLIEKCQFCHEKIRIWSQEQLTEISIKKDETKKKNKRKPVSFDSAGFSWPIVLTLLTRYAGDKFERSQHAYRTQRAQIHIQFYALRERRDEPAPKHTHPATLYYLLLYYTNTHAT